MSARSSLAALDAHLRTQNDAARRRVFGDDRPRRHKHEPALTAPMPEEPGICRWCRGRLKALVAGGPVDYCQSLCAKNDAEPYLEHCPECHRDFRTGRRHAAVCYECEQKDTAAMQQQGKTTSTYRRDAWGERHRRLEEDYKR